MNADYELDGLLPIQLLRRLHAERFCDREIADRLNDPALHDWHRLTATARREAPVPCGTWTARKVRYWRRKLGLPAPPRSRGEYGCLAEARAFHRNLTLVRWQHLLPDPCQPFPQPGRLDLRPREVAALNALHERGPLSRPDLVASAGWPAHAHTGSATYLGRLVGAELVIVLGMVPQAGRLVRRYGLAEGVRPYQGTGLPTTHDPRGRLTAEDRIREFRCSLSSLIGATFT